MPIQALAFASSRVRGAVARTHGAIPTCSVGSVQGPIRNRDAVPPASVSSGPRQSKDR
jgi:hypothetical protein